MKYPAGAIKSVQEFKEKCKVGQKVYVNEPQGYRRGEVIVQSHILVPEFGEEIFSTDGTIFIKVSSSNAWTFYSPKDELYSPYGENYNGFIFTNYWLAYAQMLKDRKHYKDAP